VNLDRHGGKYRLKSAHGHRSLLHPRPIQEASAVDKEPIQRDTLALSPEHRIDATGPVRGDVMTLASFWLIASKQTPKVNGRTGLVEFSFRSLRTPPIISELEADGYALTQTC
jgi:hypothetical protein